MLQSTTRVKLLLAYREQEFTAAVATLQGLIGGQTHNLSCAGVASPDDPASAPRFIVERMCYWGLLERRTLWESVRLRTRTGHRQASEKYTRAPQARPEGCSCAFAGQYTRVLFGIQAPNSNAALPLGAPDSLVY
jgi:hypothetical protein